MTTPASNAGSDAERSKSPKKSSRSTAGAKALITTASIAATIGGWVALSAHSPVAESAAIRAVVPALGGYVADSLPYLDPLPTLVPEPGNPGVPTGIAGPSAPAAGENRPGIKSQPEQPLRSVTAPRRAQPPAPMAVTRSSR